MVPSGLRYSELEDLTGIPRSTLIKVLNYLKSLNMINNRKGSEDTDERKSTFYILTEKSEFFIRDFIFLSINLLERTFES